MAEAISQRSRQIPAICCLLRRVGCSHDGHIAGKNKITHRPFQDHPEESRLNSGGRC
jgi:hypothetical protein